MQYGQRNNIKITGIPDSVSNQNLEEKVVDILNEISVDVSTKDIEACHCVGVSKNSLKKTKVHFINRKQTKKVLISRKKLRNNSSPSCNVFINENLTVKNNEIAFLGGKVLKSKESVDLFSLFPYYDFRENYCENEQNDSIQSSY